MFILTFDSSCTIIRKKYSFNTILYLFLTIYTHRIVPPRAKFAKTPRLRILIRGIYHRFFTRYSHHWCVLNNIILRHEFCKWETRFLTSQNGILSFVFFISRREHYCFQYAIFFSRGTQFAARVFLTCRYSYRTATNIRDVSLQIFHFHRPLIEFMLSRFEINSNISSILSGYSLNAAIMRILIAPRAK